MNYDAMPRAELIAEIKELKHKHAQSSEKYQYKPKISAKAKPTYIGGGKEYKRKYG